MWKRKVKIRATGGGRIPVVRKRENWLGVVDLGLGLPSAMEKHSEPNGKMSSPPG